MTRVFLKFVLVVCLAVAVQCIDIAKADAGNCPSEREMIALIKMWGNRYEAKGDAQRYGDVDILQVGDNPSYCPVKAKVIIEWESVVGRYKWKPVIKKIKRFKFMKNDFGEWVISPL